MSNVKASSLLKWAIPTYCILCLFVLVLFVAQYRYVRNSIDSLMNSNRETIENLTIVSDKDTKNYKLITSDAQNTVSVAQREHYQEFLEKYLEHQSYFLNFWLAALAIVLGIFAIIVPICFMKLLENKRRDLDLMIESCQKQKEQTNINLEEMQKQLKEVADMALEVKANSMLTWVNFALENGDADKVIPTINESISIKPTSENLFARAYYYNSKKDFNKARIDWEECLKMNKSPAALGNLGITYLELGMVEEAINCFKEVQNLIPNETGTYYNLTEAYLKKHEFETSKQYLLDFIRLENIPYIFDDDKIKWKEILDTAPTDQAAKDIIDIINKLAVKKRK